MLEGKCPKCGYHRIGWALKWPRNQACPKCGIGLDITRDGRRVFTGYSPFTAEKYIVNLPDNVSSIPEEETDKFKEDKQDNS